jgi:hypothetical protein
MGSSAVAAAATAALVCAIAVALLGLPASIGRGTAGAGGAPKGCEPGGRAGGASRGWPSHAQLDADAAWVERRFAVDRSRSRQPERLSGLGPEQASHYIRSGRPFIVTDVVRSWGLRDWDCESVRRDFGDEEMQLWNSYGGSARGQPARVRLSDPWQQWLFPQLDAEEDHAEAQSRADANGTASPSALPFHWYPLNGGAGAPPDEPVFGASPQSIRRLQAAYALPAFLPQESTLNERFCKVCQASLLCVATV